VKSGRSLELLCLADVRSRPVLFVRKWLNHELFTHCTPRPRVYDERVAILERIADSADWTGDEQHKREVRDLLVEQIADLRDSLETRRLLLSLHRCCLDVGVELPFTRQELARELDQDEVRQLKFDMAVD
jgi:hypothetical protein